MSERVTVEEMLAACETVATPDQVPNLGVIDGGKAPQRRKGTKPVPGSLDEHMANEAADARTSSLAVQFPWTKGSALTQDDNGRPHHTATNLALIMARDDVLQHLGTNAMGGALTWRQLPPWRAQRDDPFKRVDATADDADMVECGVRLRAYFGGGTKALTKDECTEALTRHAARNTFSPVRDYLEALPAWDGQPRCPRAIPTAPDDAYTRQALLNWFLAGVQVAYEPGSQVDSMLVLWGGQGVRKTSFFKAMAPDVALFAELDTVPDTNKGKDDLAKCFSAWIVLLDELDKLRRRDEQSALKAFITTRVGKWRSPYGRLVQTHARQFVLGGTTNQREFLLDGTGNRRYWPVEVRETIPAEFLTPAWRDALWAEARDRYKAGERYAYGPEFEALANQVRGQHLDDPVGDAIDAWLDNPVGGLVVGGVAQVDTSRLASALLVQHVPALQGTSLVKDKAVAAAIVAHMDQHPNYRRVGKARIDGKIHKVVWERI